MEIWFLAAAAVLLVAAIVHSEIAQAKRVDALEARVAKSETEYNMYTKSGGVAERLMGGVRTDCLGAMSEKYKQQAEFNAHVGKTIERYTKEQEVIVVRQRTLEKRIIGAERVVTVNLIQQPKPKGRGKGALINMGAQL